VLGAVPSSLEGIASGTNSAFRELGGVLGIAVLGAVFSSSGGYASPQDYVSGLTPAIWVGAAVVLLGVLTALLVPSRKKRVRVGTESENTEIAESDLELCAGPDLEPAI
jgi:uncharacterized membrane protein YeiH